MRQWETGVVRRWETAGEVSRFGEECLKRAESIFSGWSDGHTHQSHTLRMRQRAVDVVVQVSCGLVELRGWRVVVMGEQQW